MGNDSKQQRQQEFLARFNKDKRMSWDEVQQHIATDTYAYTEGQLIERMGREKALKLIEFLSNGTVELPDNKKIKMSKCWRDFEVEIVGGEKHELCTGDNYHFDLYNNDELMGYLSYRFSFDNESSFLRVGLDGFDVSANSTLSEISKILAPGLIELGKATQANVIDMPNVVFTSSGLEYKEHDPNGKGKMPSWSPAFRMFLPENLLTETDYFKFSEVLKEKEPEQTI